MAAILQIIIYLLFITQCMIVYATESETDAKGENSEELIESESKDGKLDIIKRIKKINDDGSYTIGYEADDGSFKIESRDVLGQIKGTYGFVDEEGQIKRVSYSTSNTSELIAKPEPTSVVQRIPTKNKTTSTRVPSTTQTTPTTTTNSVIQSIARRRPTMSTSTTTHKPNYSDVINVASRTTNRPAYSSTPSRVLLQNRLPVTSTIATQTHTAKSEGQLVRPEVVTVRSTELPLFRRLALKQLEDDKPVTEDPEPVSRGNILRRQLSQESAREYNLQEHLHSLQQSLGHDTTDVYSASMTTGTPRPLFTTTNRPRVFAVPSASPHDREENPKPTVQFPLNYRRNVLQDLERERSNQDYAQDTTTNQPVSIESTQKTVPVQIPANRAEPQEPLVAIRHPFQKGTVLIPLSQLQGRVIPVENVRGVSEHQKQYATQQEQYYRETTTRPNLVEIEQQQAVVRRLPRPPLRPIPVQVDENGFIRELPRPIQTPYPVPVPVMPIPKYIDNEIDNDVDNIEPPVSTKDLQKLLQQLIIRQSRLEKISALMKQPEIYFRDQQQQQQRYRTVYSPNPEPYYVRREPNQANGPIQFIHGRPEQNAHQGLVPRQFYEVTSEQQQKQVAVRPQQAFENQYEQQQYRPNRRVARLLPSKSQHGQQELDDDYLPPDVREMLLLRMLQLAINPALPLDEDKFDLPTSATVTKRMPVRNVEILGEEEPEEALSRPERSKRYRESEADYE